MEPKDMLEMQLAEVRRRMKENSSRLGQKIVFIHGKGEGVLRKSVLELLKKEYPKAELQDASFREYGFEYTCNHSLIKGYEIHRQMVVISGCG